MGKPKAPPAPDYAALAQQQGVESRDTAGFNTNINRANQVTPDGSLTWTMRPGADPQNPQPGDYTQTTVLSPDQQALYDSNNRIGQNFSNTAEAGLGRVGDAMGQSFNPTGLPALQTATPGQYQTSLNRSGLPDLNYGTADSRARVEAAMRARLEPQLAEQQHGLESQLLNSGLEKGSQAWNSEMDRMGRMRNDAEAQVTAAGGAEESRLAGLQSAQRGQLFGEELSSGNFFNSAIGQQIQAALAAATQGNQTRAQGWQEQLAQRQLPLNETNALRTGAQVQTPQFGSYYTGGNAQAAPVMEAGLAQGSYDMNRYNQQLGSYNALLGGLAGMGGAWLGG